MSDIGNARLYRLEWIRFGVGGVMVLAMIADVGVTFGTGWNGWWFWLPLMLVLGGVLQLMTRKVNRVRKDALDEWLRTVEGLLR